MTAGAARSVYGVVIEDGAVNAAATAAGGTVVACRHCTEILGGSGPGDILALAVHEGPPAEPGPGRAADNRQRGRLRGRAGRVPPVLLPGLLDRAVLRGRPGQPHWHLSAAFGQVVARSGP